MSFLTKKVGPLPTWGWGAVAAGGAYVLLRGGGGGGGSKGKPSDNGGQSIPNYNFKSTLSSQSIGGDSVSYATHPFGSFVSEIDESHFGMGPLSLWTGGPMEYTDVFRDHRGRDRGFGRYRGRDREGYGPHSGGRDRFNARPGGGGFGYHHWKGPGFPPPPAGGEGFDNGGQGVSGVGGSGPAASGGNPWNQQVTQGTQGGQYLVQKGDSLQSIAQRLWGPGADSSGLAAANGNLLGGGRNGGSVQAGMILTVPGAPSSGPPAPGGPAGNGVGGGSINGSGVNPGQHPAFPGMQGGDQAQPGAGTSSAGAGGGGSPTAGQSGGNSSRVKRGNASRSYAVSGSQGGGNNTQTKQTKRTRGRSR